MRKLLLATTALIALAAAPASATVVLQEKLSGTGHNVVSDTISGNLNVGHLNDPKGQPDIVDFTNLGPSVFTGASSGNDIKISNTNNLGIQVFDPTGKFVIGTTEQVFSVNGVGTLSIAVFANDKNGNPEAVQTFTGFDLDIHKPADFTLTVLDGEVMTRTVLLVTGTGANITEFEHYRIDVAPQVAAVPELSTWGMMLLGFAGVGTLAYRKRRQGGPAIRIV